MPDVGVLNLQIQENSEGAIHGLDNLVGALERVKNAVSGGLKLTPVANGLKKLADIVNENVSGSTIVKLGQLADELAKLKGLGNVNIKINGGSSIETILDAVRNTQESMSGINTGFDDIGQRATSARDNVFGFNSAMRETAELMQNKAWGGGIDQFREMFEQYSRIRSALSLPAGDQTGISTQVENGWTAWKEGAIEVEGTVSDAMDNVTARLGEPIQYLTGMSSEIGNLNDYLGKTNDLMEGMARNTTPMSGGENAIIPYAGVKEEIKEVIEETREATNGTREYANAVRDVGNAANGGGFDAAIEFARQWNQSTGSGNKVADSAKEDIAYIEELVSKSTDIDLLNMKIEALTDKLYEGATSGKMTGDQIADMIGRINSLKGEVEDLQRTTTGMTGAWNSFKGGMQALFPTISNLLKRFKSIATMRALRYVIRSISSGFSEGVQNVYQYSKAVGTSLAPAMDQAATALQQMKNSIGAAIAPVIQALVPVLQTVVNWFITAMNYANQFFALLNGQSTWTRALPEQAEAFEKSTKSAKSASNAMKDLLADWDELNIIQSQSGNGGGSGTGKTAQEYSQMFEEVSEFDSKVKDVLRFIDDYLGGIPGVLTKAGAVLLGWKFSKAFTGLLGTLGKLIAGGALIAIGLDLSYGAGFDAGAKGYFDESDILRSIVGALATAIGGSLVTSAFGIGGAVGFGIGLTVAAIVTLTGWIKGQEDLMDRSKWGNLHMTSEEIQEYVQSQFSFAVLPEITILDGVITNEQTARENLDTNITTFKNSLQKAEIQASISVDSSETGAAVTQAAADAKLAIEAVENLLKANNEGITVLMDTFKFVDDQGNDISSELLKSISIADKSVQDYFTDIGTQLAHWVSEGETKGWNEDITKQALELMRREQRIFEEAEKMKYQIDFESKYENSKDKIIDRDTALEQREYQEQLLGEYRDKASEALKTQYDTATYLAGLAQAAADDAMEQAQKAFEAGDIDQYNHYMNQRTGLLEAVETYTTEAQTALDAMDHVDDKLLDTKKKMAEDWKEIMYTLYGNELYQAAERQFNSEGSPMEWFDNIFGVGQSSKFGIEEDIKKLGYEGAAEKYRTGIKESFSNADPNGFYRFMLEDLEMPIWDIMNEQMRQVVAANLVKNAPSVSEAYELFKDIFQITPEEASKYIDFSYQDIWEETINPDEQINVPVEVVPELSIDMDALKKEIEELIQDGRLDFDEIQYLAEKYQSDKALDEALKQMYITLDDEGYLTGRNPLKNGYYAASGGAAGGGVGGGGMPVKPYDIGYPQTSGVTGSGTNVGMTENDLTNGVAAGTARGNEGQNELINIAIGLLRQIAAKDMTVNITPSASMGFMNGMAAAMAGKVTGDI